MDDLKKHFTPAPGASCSPSRQGRKVVRAVDGVSFEHPPGRDLRPRSASPGCGQDHDGQARHEADRAHRRARSSSTARDVTDDSTRTQTQAYRRQVQMIFQDPYASMNPRFKIRDVLEEPLRDPQDRRPTAPSARTWIVQALDRGQADARPRISWARYPHMLSGGQRQRVGHGAHPDPEPAMHRRRRAGLHDRPVHPGRDPRT
ncbi:MAG: hypothetical protein M0C28_22805 [Candidatus Moduliflexus flocculans]|nr:hypothetical protein [Candidatus Moduliflexus flocculans]